MVLQATLVSPSSAALKGAFSLQKTLDAVPPLVAEGKRQVSSPSAQCLVPLCPMPHAQCLYAQCPYAQCLMPSASCLVPSVPVPHTPCPAVHPSRRGGR